jgi:16S rRNA (adenine1518-N6/adenine1519-N6)-dimethyltransferase
MTPSELRTMLARHGIRPLRDRGQHFLLDERVVAVMAGAAAVAAGDRVLEIGPGPGILTAELLARGAEVAAVELDRKMCALLTDRFPSPRFHLIQGDILSFGNADLLTHFDNYRLPTTDYKLASNLPYNITSAVIEKFLTREPKPSSMTVMVQREVADRILAKPGAMSSLAVMVRTYAIASRVVDVPPGAFLPPPAVRSSVIHMEVRTQSELAAFFGDVRPERYFSLVRTAFAGKRRQLANSLRGLFSGADELKNALDSAKIDGRSRPEELGVSDWLALAANVRQ